MLATTQPSEPTAVLTEAIKEMVKSAIQSALAEAQPSLVIEQKIAPRNYLTVPKALEYLGQKDRAWMYGEIRSKRLKALKVRGKWIMTYDACDALMEQIARENE